MKIMVKLTGDQWPPEVRGQHVEAVEKQFETEHSGFHGHWSVCKGFEIEAVQPELPAQVSGGTIPSLFGATPSRVEITFK